MIVKKPLLFLALALLVLAFAPGCSSKDDSPVLIDDPSPGTYSTINVTVQLPSGSNISLKDTKLVSLSESFTVSNDGKSKVALNEGSNTLAILYDKDGNILLSGFVKNENSTISVKSTVVTNLYFSLGTVFLPYAVKEKFFSEINTFPGLGELVENASEGFASNSQYLFSDEFAKVIGDKIKELEDEKETLNPYARITADGSDIRSGIQLREDNSFSFSFINSYRRRAHAFVYKDNITYEDGSTSRLINNYGKENPTADYNKKIPSPTAIREVAGVIADWANGTGLGFARTEAGPITLEDAADNEKEIIYKSRVIGTSIGAIPRTSMTTAEKEKLDELIMETFTYELTLPIFLDIIGHYGIIDNIDESNFKTFAEVLKITVASIPAADEALKKGDYKGALNSFLSSFYNNTLGDKTIDLLKSLLDGVAAAGIPLSPDYFVQNSVKAADIIDGMENVLKAIDPYLKGIDYTRILYANSNSKYLEEWDVKVEKSDIKLSPSKATIVRGRYTDFEVLAEPTPEEGAVLQYEWSTTGRFGVISDNASHIDQTSFTSSKDKISYVTTVSEDELSDDDNIEKITVTVSIKKGNTITKIGTRTATINIKKFKYKIRPDGVTVQGGNAVRLDIVRSDRVPLTDGNGFESKVIWSTSGKYGLFNGVTDQVTQERTGSYELVYEALDKDVQNATETITAMVYRKETIDSEWILYDEVEANIKIDNNPNKKTYFRNIRNIFIKNEENNGHNWWGVYAVIDVPKEENAISYQLNVINVTFLNGLGEPITRHYTMMMRTPEESNYYTIVEGDTYMPVFVRNGGGNFESPSQQAHINRALATTGLVQVVVTLKPD